MNDTEKKRRAKYRRKHLLEKLRSPSGWTIEALLAYCQGRAYDVGADTANLVTEGARKTNIERRKEAVKCGLLSMIDELSACINVLEDDG